MVTRHIDADRIRSIHLFKHVSESHFHALLRAASVRQVPPRSMLFKEGSRPNELYTLLSGSVELFSEYRDRHCTLAIVRTVKPFVLASIWQDRHRLSARTLAASQILLIPASRLHKLIEIDRGFASAATAELAAECNDALEKLKNGNLRSSTERLAQWLLRFDRETGGAGQFVIPCDKRTLASYLGMAPEHLSRNLAALAPSGLVVRGRRVALNNRSALEIAAGLNLPSAG